MSFHTLNAVMAHDFYFSLEDWIALAPMALFGWLVVIYEISKVGPSL